MIATIRRRLWAFLVPCWVGVALGQVVSAPPAGVVSSNDALPPREGAYHGGGVHVFLDGQIAATCSSHGGFSRSVPAPARPGSTVVADYSATFVGELTLVPPAAPRRTVHPLRAQARMTERIRLAEAQGATRVFDTEMVTLDIRGRGLPDGVLLRESPAARSTGRTTVTTLARDRYQIDSFYDIWLEVSLDGGRTWHRAQDRVRLSLGPIR